MEKNFNFTTAFAMRCDAEQFESVIKEFIQMGYETETTTPFETDYYLINNFAGGDRVTNTREDNKNINNRLVIETFNRELCLALAAMTNKPDGIVGEWFKGSNGAFIQKKDDCDIASIATKATADELIKHFSEIKPEQKQPETDPQIEALQKRIEDLEYNVKQLAESMQNVREPEPQPASIFADKQPLWAWEDGWKTVREVVFWDAENECTFGNAGIRGGYSFDNYEPIPADQIPAWMVDAAKHLED